MLASSLGIGTPMLRIWVTIEEGEGCTGWTCNPNSTVVSNSVSGVAGTHP